MPNVKTTAKNFVMVSPRVTIEAASSSAAAAKTIALAAHPKEYEPINA
jgi:hypothetical protein